MFNPIRVFFVAAIFFAVHPAFAQPFVHPGGLHTQADFDRMKAKVAANQSPWVGSYNYLTAVGEAQTNWYWAPVVQIIRGPSGSNYARSQNDALAIYCLALRWRITGDTNFAEKAIQGCDAWSSTMTNGVGGDSNWALGVGICGYEFAVAGEALRGYTNWSQTSLSNYCNFLKIFAGGNDSFLTNHNGTCDSHYWANWDSCNLASLMACGVFLDDTNMFNRAVTYIKQGSGNGNMTSFAWLIHTNGLAQQQESARDQAHSMDGIAWMGVACQVAWNQGVDLYGFDNNLFLRTCEYYAKYGLGNNVPFVSFGVCEPTFSWGTTTLSSGSRGFFPPTWDMFYNHYVNVMGLSAPYTAQAAALYRPDGFYANNNSPDFIGFSTLTCFLDPIPAGAVPSGLTANVSGNNVALTWWGSAYATNYNVKRATVSGGPYTTIGTVSSTADRYFMDSTVTNGGTYYYVVSGLDKFGESANSPEKTVCILSQLVAYYKFNETNFATAADSSGLGRPAAIFMNSATNVSGKFGNAVNLNGSSQYVLLPTNIVAGLNDCTIATWVYLNTLSSYSRIFDFGADTDRYMFLTPSTGSAIRFAISKFTSNGEQRIDGNAVLSAGSWHHVAVTIQGSEGTGIGVLYVDGVPVGTNSGMYYTPDMIGRLVNCTNNYIGRSQFSSDPYLNGKVDDFRIYNGALSAAQIAALYALSPVAPAAPATINATVSSASVINLSWSAVSGATNYVVQRSLTSGGPYAVIGSGITATNFTDVSLSGNTTYYYVLAAVNNAGTSTNSLQASATTLTPPAMPTSLASTGFYGGLITLSWTASGGATSYNVKRSLLSGGPYVTIATGVTSTGYTNSGLLFNATYYYVVSAVNANGESLNSNEAGSLVPVPTFVWQGNVNTNWDINTTTNWLFSGSPATYSDGSATIINDTAIATNINLTAGVAPYSILFSNITKNLTVSSANGSGIGGAATFAKFGAGTLTLNNANSFTGDMTINAGTVTIGGAGQLGGGNYAGDIANYGTFIYNSSAPQMLSGQISAAGGLLKTGTGSLTLSGPNSFTGSTLHRQGTLNLTGAGKSGGGIISIVDNNAASTTNAVLNISSDVAAYSLWLGDFAGSGQVGAAYQKSGDVIFTEGASIYDFRVGSLASGRGYYKLSGGTLTANEIDVGSEQNDTIGIVDMTGGTMTINGWMNIGHGGATGSGLFNLLGGSASSARVDMNWSGTSGAVSVINVGGGNTPASLTVAASTSLGVNLANSSTTAGTLSVVNLLTNGTLTTGIVRADQANPSTFLNFNGGTLQANISSGNFLTDGNVDNIYVYPNGGTIDNGGNLISVARPLLAPASLGVSSISGPSSPGSGYVAAPLVTITGGTGSGATAYAVMTDDGTGKGTYKVSNIVVTCPGVYTVAPTTVTLISGGTGSAASGFTIGTAANTSGGISFIGSGTTFLSSSNSYTGPTTISGGTVQQSGPLLHLSFDNVNGTTVINDAGNTALNGTLTGTAAIVPGGRSGNALQITGTAKNAGYVYIGGGSGLPLSVATGAAWTVAYWLKTTQPGSICMYQGTGGWGWNSSGGPADTLIYCGSGTPESLASSTHIGIVSYGHNWEEGTANIADGNWHFVVMTCSGTTKVNYVDGVLDSLQQSTLSGVARGNQLWIGGCPTAVSDAVTNLNGGLIDDVYVYGRALNQSEVTNLMNGNTVSSPAALPAGNDLIAGVGGTLVLSSSSQVVGTLSGANSGNIQLGAGSTPTALTFGKSASATFAGSIVGNGSVTKVGSGTTTISGVNSYNGSTVISNGTVNFGQSDNTNYVATLGPILQLTFDQIGRTTLFTNDNDGTVTTNTDSSVINTGLGGAAFDGTLNGAGATIVGGGRYGNALSLSGGSYLYIDDKVTPLDCNTYGSPWTYALWIKTSTAGATFGYQGDGTWSSSDTTFYLNNNNSTSGGTKVGGVRWGDSWLTGTTNVNNNAWHFIAITVSAGVKTIYVDGKIDAQTGTTGWVTAAPTSANQFWIGATPDTSGGETPFSGLIDEVYMFNRALSQSEVQNIMSNQTAVAYGVTTGNLPPATPVNLASGAILDLTGTSQTIASLVDIGGNGGAVTNSAGTLATLTLSSANTNTFSGKICDASTGNALSLIKSGSGTQNLNGANNYNGNTTVNGGTLAFSQTTLPTNGIVTVTNGAVLGLNFTGTNRVGGIVLNGVTKTPGVYNAANSAPYLAGTGSLQIATPVATNATSISFGTSGGTLTLSWPSDHTGWQLQSQTNSLNTGLGTNWMNVPNSNVTNQFAAPIVFTNGSVFYRLTYP